MRRCTSGFAVTLLISQSIAPSGSCMAALSTCEKARSISVMASDALPSLPAVSAFMTASAIIVSFITTVSMFAPRHASTAATNGGSTSMNCASAPWIAGLKNSGLSSPLSTACVPCEKLSPLATRPRSTSSFDSLSESARCTLRTSWSSAASRLCVSRSAFSAAATCALALSSSFCVRTISLSVCSFCARAVSVEEPSTSSSPERIARRASAPSRCCETLEICPRKVARCCSSRCPSAAMVVSARSASARWPAHEATAACFSSSRRSSLASRVVICSSSASVSWSCVSAMRSFSSPPATSDR